jgi:hypothetical protein
MMLTSMIKQNKVSSTPTSIIKYADGDVKRYVGTDEIGDGLAKLKSHLGMDKK